ncbi:MAG: ribonuclease H-like YkuK family protein [Patescibacteria group bacterium]|nr:ribonuclease H-like YkuK family protein [Patescibacteria group bacterium]MCL5224344.1 ribonuclease H-like YkuK family protein [Patescibacteria group bacterium]
MSKASSDKFCGAFGALFSPKEVAREIIAFMKADPDRSYKVIIGTDSLLYDKTKADFVTAIVVHRIGNGGRYFWRRTELDNFYSLRSRITREVVMSLDVARDILEFLRVMDAPRFGFEIHVDVGEKGETKVIIQELLGMIRAHNFEARTKPDSYAASSVADRHVA